MVRAEALDGCTPEGFFALLLSYCAHLSDLPGRAGCAGIDLSISLGSIAAAAAAAVVTGLGSLSLWTKSSFGLAAMSCSTCAGVGSWTDPGPSIPGSCRALGVSLCCPCTAAFATDATGWDAPESGVVSCSAIPAAAPFQGYLLNMTVMKVRAICFREELRPVLQPSVIRLSRSVPRSRILRRLASAAADLLAM